MKKLLRGGFVVTPRGSRRADVLLDGEKIAQVGHISPAEAKSAEVTDVSGCYLFPGFIDAHTHFDLDVCNTTTADDFASGTRSAIRGGTTTIIDFACPNKGETLAYGLDLWHKKADSKCSCDYGFHMTIDDWNEGIEGELDDMFAAGITSFKMYLTYPAMMIGDGAVYSALKALKKRGGIAGVHCENAGVIDARIAELKAAGRAADVSAHPEARPDYLEAEAVARLLRIAEAADAPVVIVHLTNREALDEVAFARARGQRVYVETCPQYLALDDGVYYDANWSMAARYVCAPPIRAEENQRALWRGLQPRRDPDHLHRPLLVHPRAEGHGPRGLHEFPGGLPGVRRGGSSHPRRRRGRMTVAGMCRALCRIPRAHGLYPRKGVIAAAPTRTSWSTIPRPATSSPRATWSKAGYTPFEGLRTEGGIAKVYLRRGSLMVEDGRIVGGPEGQYLRRGSAPSEQNKRRRGTLP